MASSLLSGVSGLRGHQQMLDVVGNNLANINTVGYKAQRLRFADLFSQTLREATGAVGGLGGTNPLQIGLGVKTAAIETDLAQGSLEATGRTLDLAIQGVGLFVVRDGAQKLFTRAGAFGVDENNTMVDPASGFRVQRFGTVGEANATTPGFQIPGNQDIQIPFGTSIPGLATTTLTLTGNLDAGAVGPLAETLVTNLPFTDTGAPAVGTTLLDDLDSNLAPYIVGDQILISGTDTDGTPISTSLAVGLTTDLDALRLALSAAYSGATATIDASGNLVLLADQTGPAQLSLTLSDDPGNSGSTDFSTHNMVLTVDGKDGDTVGTSLKIFDVQGNDRDLFLTFQKQGNNVWDLTVTVNPAEGTVLDGLVSGIEFNDDGSFRQVTGTGVGDGNFEVQWNGLSSPQTVAPLLGSGNGFDGVTQFGGATSAAATGQDGFDEGYLIDIAVNADGVIEGIFTNGQTLPIAQLEVASFTNPAGLKRVGDGYFSLTSNSGLAVPGAALTGGRGPIRSGGLETSNVDVALEFTRLIIAQSGFQVNARTITTTDEVLQELANLIR